MRDIVGRLRGGDRRSIGHSEEVARDIAENPKLLERVLEAILGPDPVVRMRAADAIEKATRERPELLQPYKSMILRRLGRIEQQEVRWHLAQILPRLRLSSKELDNAMAILLDDLEHRSSIVRTFAMQSLADLAIRHPALQSRVVPLLEHLTSTGTAAMRSRGQKLLKRFRS